MSLGDHFRELRNRLLVASLAVAALSVVGWVFYDSIIAFFIAPIEAVSRQRGDDDLVTSDDGAPGRVEVAQDRPVVARVVLQLLGAEDGDPVQLHEQHQEAQQQADAELGDLVAHAPALAVRCAATLLSEMRSSRASST